MKTIIIFAVLPLLLCICYQYCYNTKLHVDLRGFESFDCSLEDTEAHGRLQRLHDGLVDKIDENNAEALAQLGMFYTVYGYPYQASAAYDAALLYDPHYFNALYGNAQVASMLGLLESAHSYYKRALDVGETQRSIQQCNYKLGLISLRMEKADAAHVYFEAAGSDRAHMPSLYQLALSALDADDEQTFIPLYEMLKSNCYDAVEVYHLSLSASARFRGVEALTENAQRERMLSVDSDSKMNDAIRTQFGLTFEQIQGQRYGENGRSEPVSDEQFNAGKSIYESAGCVSCHGQDGSGKIGPSLIDEQWLYGSTISAIRASITNGRKHNVMPAQKYKLNKQQIDDLAAYVFSLNQRTLDNK